MYKTPTLINVYFILFFYCGVILLLIS